MKIAEKEKARSDFCDLIQGEIYSDSDENIFIVTDEGSAVYLNTGIVDDAMSAVDGPFRHFPNAVLHLNYHEA